MDSWSTSASIPTLNTTGRRRTMRPRELLCMTLCTAMHSLLCSSFFYDTQYRSCLLTSHTGEVPDDADTCGVKRVEYYRRKRCLSRLLLCLTFFSAVRGLGIHVRCVSRVGGISTRL